MSAPDTNIEKQEKRHRGPLYGMKIVVAIALILMIGLFFFLAENGNTPGEVNGDVIIQVD